MGKLSALGQLVGGYGCLMVSQAPPNELREHKLAKAQHAMTEMFGHVVREELIELYKCISFWERMLDSHDWIVTISHDGLAIANTSDQRVVPHQHLIMTFTQNLDVLLSASPDRARNILTIRSLETARKHKIQLYPSSHLIGNPSETFRGLEHLFVASSIFSGARARKEGFFDEGKFEAANRGSASLTAVLDKLELVSPDDKQDYVVGLVYGYGMTMGLAMAPFVQENLTGTQVLVALLKGLQQAVRSSMIQSETIKEMPDIMAELAELISRIDSVLGEFVPDNELVN